MGVDDRNDYLLGLICVERGQTGGSRPRNGSAVVDLSNHLARGAKV